MHERIAKIIDATRLKKIEFAKRLGISAPFVSELCTGVKKPSDRTIADICREFNISETWLRTGDGEMFKKTPDSIAEQLAAEFGLDEFMQSVVSEYLKLNGEQRQVVRDFVSRIAAEAPPTDPGQGTAQPAVEVLAPETDPVKKLTETVAALEKQNQELAARLEVMEKEDAEQEAQGAAARIPSQSL